MLSLERQSRNEIIFIDTWRLRKSLLLPRVPGGAVFFEFTYRIKDKKLTIYAFLFIKLVILLPLSIRSERLGKTRGKRKFR